MASDVDICNLALARLGDEATVASIAPPEGSVQAGACARFYPLARDALLQKHPWTFALQEQTLAALADTVPGWAHAWALPANTLNVLAVLPEHCVHGSAARVPFVVQVDASGQRVILTHEPVARARLIVRVTDATQFSPLFVDALGWLLASHLAGPLIKGQEGAAQTRACVQACEHVLEQARLMDAGQRHTPPEHLVPWLAGR